MTTKRSGWQPEHVSSARCKTSTRASMVKISVAGLPPSFSPQAGLPCYATGGTRRRRWQRNDACTGPVLPGGAPRRARKAGESVQLDGASFLFDCGAAQLAEKPKIVKSICHEEVSEEEGCRGQCAYENPKLTYDAFKLPPFELPHAAALLPAARAVATAHLGLSPAVAVCCIPIVTPFSMPQMSPAAWFSNKRALAYNRCVIVTVYAQGVCAVLKFCSGNMVGGFFDGIQAGMGYYSLMPEGLRFFPTYMMMAGFNGFIGLLQVLQTYNGVPVHVLPVLQVVPPIMAIASAYFGWQFCKEVRKIAAGLPDDIDGPSSCLVKIMGGDWWPSCLSAPLYGRDGNQRDHDADGSNNGGGIAGLAGRAGGVQQRFSVFEGNGHRLGES